ncbi:hypothetical protein GC177_04875 [bacterium]|nr:hypothetical protein [bacterium]
MLTHTSVFDQMEHGYVGGKCAEFCHIITPYLKSWGVPAIEMYMQNGPQHAVIFALSDDHGVILIDPTAHQFRFKGGENAPQSWVCMPIDEAFDMHKGSVAHEYWEKCTYAAMPNFHRIRGRNLPPEDLVLLDYLSPLLKLGLNMELHHMEYSDEENTEMAFRILQHVHTYSETEGYQSPFLSNLVPHEAPTPDQMLAQFAAQEQERELYVEERFARDMQEVIYSRFVPEFLQRRELNVVPDGLGR